MIEDILLLSGNDIPFLPARINIHQPRIKEIAYIGEKAFFTACQFLNFSKEALADKDKEGLTDIEDFHIIMSILNDQNSKEISIYVNMLLSLIFPDRSIIFNENSIYLTSDEDVSILNIENYDEFKSIIIKIFHLEKKEEDFNPANERARSLVEKIKKGKDAAARARGEDPDKIAIFSRLVSILSVGLGININTLLNYTVYQLYDVNERFNLYQANDIHIKAQLAGATDLEKIDNWMKDIHS